MSREGEEFPQVVYEMTFMKYLWHHPAAVLSEYFQAHSVFLSHCSPHKNWFCHDKNVRATLNLPSIATTCPVPRNPCSAVQGGTLLPCPSPMGDHWGPGLLAVPCMDLLSKPCLWVTYVFILISFDYLI